MALKQFWILPTTALKFLMLKIYPAFGSGSSKVNYSLPPTHSGHGRFLRSQGQWRCVVVGGHKLPQWWYAELWPRTAPWTQAGVCPRRSPRNKTAGGDQVLRADQMLLKGERGSPRKMSWEREGGSSGKRTSGFWSDRLGAKASLTVSAGR